MFYKFWWNLKFKISGTQLSTAMLAVVRRWSLVRFFSSHQGILVRTKEPQLHLRVQIQAMSPFPHLSAALTSSAGMLAACSELSTGCPLLTPGGLLFLYPRHLQKCWRYLLLSSLKQLKRNNNNKKEQEVKCFLLLNPREASGNFTKTSWCMVYSGTCGAYFTGDVTDADSGVGVRGT